ncbi:MAG: hypothetical protein M3Y44_10540 [Actinomycetota bacterium]|nr:hypothetical protein [Actinomycetota bacterium]
MYTTTAQGAVFALVAVAAVVVIARFELFCLRELARVGDADLQYLTRRAWGVAIILMIPLGGLAFLSFGRPQ